MSEHIHIMRSKFELEYNLNCSPKVLFSRLSTPEGLGEWFADQVNVDGDLFTFFWNSSESKFFEFRINLEELTNELALIITDFAEAEEKEDSIYLWDSQINDLKRALGI